MLLSYWAKLRILTYFMPLISFDTPRKHQKTRGFFMFSGVSEEISDMKWVNKTII